MSGADHDRGLIISDYSRARPMSKPTRFLPRSGVWKFSTVTRGSIFKLSALGFAAREGVSGLLGEDRISQIRVTGDALPIRIEMERLATRASCGFFDPGGVFRSAIASLMASRTKRLPIFPGVSDCQDQNTFTLQPPPLPPPGHHNGDFPPCPQWWTAIEDLRTAYPDTPVMPRPSRPARPALPA